MPNGYFQFKQFLVRQDACAMKVCTDACIFGAWFARLPLLGHRELDIGSGTGLLMLMAAQQQPHTIHGIELDPAAYGQLSENIAASPWKDRLRAFAGDVRGFAPDTRYDHILSNPPFFEGDLPSGNASRNRAMHSQELTLEELLQATDALLTDQGTFTVLLPFHRQDYFIRQAAGHGYTLQKSLLVQQTPRHTPFRAMLHFTRNPPPGPGELPVSAPAQEFLIIRDEQDSYTPAFVDLLKDYYLYL
jgi:tRNA1Val (adenine37-N6)-methyltransferase